MRVVTIDEIGEDAVRKAFIASADKYFRGGPRKFRKRMGEWLQTVPLDEFLAFMFDAAGNGRLYFDFEVNGEVVRFADDRQNAAGSA
ncbi:hypothetical protein JOD31_001562 [Methylopila capsulata]|uniref:Uncharacterized protein n=1 Tax=Methylopila capsulata TaxID=61654 RepID=A0A9W6ISA4_9HYPH|nr:hypothetical protein [Methylopila capsulata]MBM7851337.1 hypothetical protein [Methylopila capsulata]GLK54395.1 hypothetical protein GCM10008170_04140 [Methylopila capsulata]